MTIRSVKECIAIEDDTDEIVVECIDLQFTVLLGTEHAFIACGEVFQFHTRSKGRVSAIVQVDGFCRSQLGGRSSFHLFVIPEGSLESPLTVGGVDAIEHAYGNFISRERAALDVFHIGEILADAFQDGGSLCRLTVVVAP